MQKIIDKKFYQKELRPDRQHSYKTIIHYIMANIAPDARSIVEYGCGSGWFLYYFKKDFGITNLLGIEPNPAIKEFVDPTLRSYIKNKDLKYDLNLKHFDIAMCIEVVEHIEETFANIAIQNITKCSDLLIFSAATPGQGGCGHINEQPFEYWEDKLNRVNFGHDVLATQKMREYLKFQKVNTWYYRNVSLFRRA